jgi:hypothetical protein
LSYRVDTSASVPSSLAHFLIPQVSKSQSGTVSLWKYVEIVYIGVLISLWLFLFPIFLFAAQPNEFFLDKLKKLEGRSHKRVELRGNM